MYFVNPVSLFFVVFTFVIIQSMCSGGAKLIKNILRSNQNWRGKYSIGAFQRGKHLKVDTAAGYYLE